MLIRDKNGDFKEVSRILPILKARKESKKDKITNERQAVVKEFVDQLNTERQGTDFKPLSGRFVAIKVAHLNLFDLKYFLGSCRDAKNFSSHFWYNLKTGEENGQKRLL